MPNLKKWAKLSVNRTAGRYPFTPLNENEGAFFFVTDLGCSYTVDISNTHNKFNGHELLTNAGQTYEVSFDCTVGEGRRKSDDSVAPTILHILGSNIISRGDTSTYFFVCDTTDGKGKARASLFDEWFLSLQEYVPLLEKYNFIVPGFDDDEYDVSLLIFSNHPSHDEYISEFEQNLSEDFAKR